jgi:2-iminobutanoate/2-iminopropanoate deaminase
MPRHEVVLAPGAEPPAAPYSPAILSEGSRVLHISGQVAGAGEDGTIPSSAEEQARQCLDGIDALLRAVGGSKTDVVRVGIFLTDIAERPAVAKARVDYFGDHKPAATLVQVSALVDPALKVEIEATAVL